MEVASKTSRISCICAMIKLNKLSVTKLVDAHRYIVIHPLLQDIVISDNEITYKDLKRRDFWNRLNFNPYLSIVRDL
jgi:hypothetical protein